MQEGIGRGKARQGVEVVGVAEEVVIYGWEDERFVAALFAPGRVASI